MTFLKIIGASQSPAFVTTQTVSYEVTSCYVLSPDKTGNARVT